MLRRLTLMLVMTTMCLLGANMAYAETIFEVQMEEESPFFDVAGSSYNFSFLPGETVSDSFYLVNYSSSPITLKIDERDAELDEAGDLNLSAREGQGVSAWLNMPDEIELAPESSQEVAFEIQFPDGTFSKVDYYSNIFIEMNSTNEDLQFKEQVGIRIHAQLADILFLNDEAAGNYYVSALQISGNAIYMVIFTLLYTLLVSFAFLYLYPRKAWALLLIFTIGGGALYLPFSYNFATNVLNAEDGFQAEAGVSDNANGAQLPGVVPVEVVQPEPENLDNFVEYDLVELSVEEIVEAEEMVKGNDGKKTDDQGFDEKVKDRVPEEKPQTSPYFSEILFDTKSEDGVVIKGLELFYAGEQPVNLTGYFVDLNGTRYPMDGVLKKDDYYLVEVQEKLSEENFYIHLKNGDQTLESFVYDPEGKYLKEDNGDEKVMVEESVVEPVVEVVVVDETVVVEEPLAEELVEEVVEEVVVDEPVVVEVVEEEVVEIVEVTPEIGLEKAASKQKADEEKLAAEGLSMRFDYLKPFQSLSAVLITKNGSDYSLQDTKGEVAFLDTKKAWLFFPHGTPFDKNEFLNDAPSAKVELVSTSTSKEGLLATFSAAGSSDPDGDELTYVWNFGGAGLKFGEEVSVLLSKTGVGFFTLKVTDEFDEYQKIRVTYYLSETYEFERTSIVMIGKDEETEDDDSVFDKFKDGFFVKFSDETIVISGLTVSTEEQDVTVDLGRVFISGIRPMHLMGIITIEPDADTLDYISPEDYVLILDDAEMKPYYVDEYMIQYSLKEWLKAQPHGTRLKLDLQLKIIVPAFTPDGYYSATVSYSFY